jgi:hypothetical protein
MGYAELHGAIDYLAIWRDVYPHIRIPAGYSVQPLMSVEDARRSGARFVRLELVSAPSPSETGKGYVLTHVQHSGG